MTKEKNVMSGKPRATMTAIAIVLVVVVVFVIILFAKGNRGAIVESKTGGSGIVATTTDSAVADGSLTSKHNDASMDYEAALRTGKPVYVLFHSLTCQPCVEISAVVDKVLPAYQGKVVFVNAITDDQSTQQLASKFEFQYIPTSFFIKPGGKVVDSYTGAMSDVEMKARLDRLVAQ